MTSKEQAEELFNSAWSHAIQNECDIKESFDKFIPLTELLEVAKAAVEYERTNSITARLECGIAIKALRATNKIKGL